MRPARVRRVVGLAAGLDGLVRSTDVVMVTEVLCRWRVRRGAHCAVVRTRTALPARPCTALVAVPVAPVAVCLGGDELRVRAGLLALGVQL